MAIKYNVICDYCGNKEEFQDLDITNKTHCSICHNILENYNIEEVIDTDSIEIEEDIKTNSVKSNNRFESLLKSSHIDYSRGNYNLSSYYKENEESIYQSAYIAYLAATTFADKKEINVLSAIKAFETIPHYKDASAKLEELIQIGEDLTIDSELPSEKIIISSIALSSIISGVYGYFEKEFLICLLSGTVLGSMLLTVVAFVIYSFTAKAKRKKLPMAERKELVLSLLEA